METFQILVALNETPPPTLWGKVLDKCWTPTMFASNIYDIAALSLTKIRLERY